MTNTDIQAGYVGSSEVVKIYLGSNVVWEKQSPEPAPSGYTAMPLTFLAKGPGVIKFGKGNLGSAFTINMMYSVNGDPYETIEQTAMDNNTFNIPVNEGDEVSFVGYNTQFSKSNSVMSYTFTGTTCACDIYGNIMSILDGDNYATMTSIPSGVTGQYTFYSLFRNVPVEDAENLILPAMTLNAHCYTSMFYGCSGLTLGPILPATDLTATTGTNPVNGCYSSMFRQCKQLYDVVCLAERVGSSGILNQCFQNILTSATPGGVWYQSPNTTITWPRTGASAIVPTGWSIEDYDGEHRG